MFLVWQFFVLLLLFVVVVVVAVTAAVKIFIPSLILMRIH
jgi:hypothetical protein